MPREESKSHSWNAKRRSSSSVARRREDYSPKDDSVKTAEEYNNHLLKSIQKLASNKANHGARSSQKSLSRPSTVYR